MDRKNEINTFEEIGMANPLKAKKSIKEAIQQVKLFDFYSEVYPEALMHG